MFVKCTQNIIKLSNFELVKHRIKVFKNISVFFIPQDWPGLKVSPPCHRIVYINLIQYSTIHLELFLYETIISSF